jgi:hypothetical protein
MPRYLNKRYIRIPGGEIQYGYRTGMILIWFRGRKYTVRRPRTA